MNKILVVGDVHNDFGKLNSLINVKRPELIICCGEFGYWPRQQNAKQIEMIKTHGAKLLWIEGNHEDFWALKAGEYKHRFTNVQYMPRGSTYTLPDGRNIFFMGGASSIDKQYRTLGIDWFPEEVITQADLIKLPKMKIDIFITHTCPEELLPKLIHDDLYERDPSREALSWLKNHYKPSLWIFAHWHMYAKGQLDGINWFCLGSVESMRRWWMWLPGKEED